MLPSQVFGTFDKHSDIDNISMINSIHKIHYNNTIWFYHPKTDINQKSNR